MKILIVQNNAILNNKQANFDNVEKLMEPYIDEQIDLVLLPEVWAVGWDCKQFVDAAEKDSDSQTLDFLKYIAQKHRCLVLGGSYIREDSSNLYKNTMPVISSKGEILALYDKMHLFSHIGAQEHSYVTKGENLVILDLGYTKIGLSICYDIRFPELFRKYANNGVEIFVSAAAWGQNKLMHWEIMQKARAIENQCYMLAADQTGKISGSDFNLGHSMVISPWGDVIDELGCEEGCILAELDLIKLRKLRKDFPLLKDRRNEQFQIKEINVYE